MQLYPPCVKGWVQVDLQLGLMKQKKGAHLHSSPHTRHGGVVPGTAKNMRDALHGLGISRMRSFPCSSRPCYQHCPLQYLGIHEVFWEQSLEQNILQVNNLVKRKKRFSSGFSNSSRDVSQWAVHREMPIPLTCNPLDRASTSAQAWERGWLLGGQRLGFTKRWKGSSSEEKAKGRARELAGWPCQHHLRPQLPASQKTQVLSCPYGVLCNSNRIYAPSI